MKQFGDFNWFSDSVYLSAFEREKESYKNWYCEMFSCLVCRNCHFDYVLKVRSANNNKKFTLDSVDWLPSNGLSHSRSWAFVWPKNCKLLRFHPITQNLFNVSTTRKHCDIIGCNVSLWCLRYFIVIIQNFILFRAQYALLVLVYNQTGYVESRNTR